jgi:hypothetical protein
MAKTHTHFEQVPVEVAEKILEQQSSLAKRDGHRKVAVKKSGRITNRPFVVPRKVEVLAP